MWFWRMLFANARSKKFRRAENRRFGFDDLQKKRAAASPPAPATNDRLTCAEPARSRHARDA